MRIVRYFSGRVYVGAMEGTKKEGRGLEWQDDCFFIGDWVDGKREGYGIEVQGPHEYCGEWKAGAKHGQGREKNQEGEYEGGFMFGLRHGQGQLSLPNGGYYKGAFASNLYHGNGELFVDGRLYKGDFMRGQYVEPAPARSTSEHIGKGQIPTQGAKRFNIRSTKKVQKVAEVPSFEESSISVSRRESMLLVQKDECWRHPISEESELAKEID